MTIGDGGSVCLPIRTRNVARVGHPGGVSDPSSTPAPPVHGAPSRRGAGRNLSRVGRRRERAQHAEVHTSGRAGWLRAGVLGANDGLLSTSSLLIGVASASAGRSVMLVSGVASIVAGAGSMAIGEFSSVSSQRDAERADLAVEAEELRTGPRAELAELTGIYVQRGLDPDLAREVATQLTEADALRAHARDELGIDPEALARPLQAAVVSAVSFTLGALIPLLVVAVTAQSVWVPVLVLAALIGLGALGAVGAWLGGAPLGRASARVLLGGAAAMALAWVVGQAFDVAAA